MTVDFNKATAPVVAETTSAMTMTESKLTHASTAVVSALGSRPLFQSKMKLKLAIHRTHNQMPKTPRQQYKEPLVDVTKSDFYHVKGWTVEPKID
mmetsp:Transcript_47240/g.143044  ORF Transcript_47240/g.143044 Transcript_47240/m.143044 type:complete len:95 (+) Transcript_47240:1274-1558(+)